ncbi:PucR family transcriptional regulator [Leucobacter sp. OLJS4]|uniref:PucR family transcriptional regulator n=1 Tax=unclassified Leucobacter TaxID=2621730 RepID=UPI000C1995EA|nr:MULTISPECIES: helix-turn-helix domain-containing protein [unclassified Leucobacter]PII85822.1 PucR family transcriptional regulator [Leucobacter sp. OLCALW19]PII92895.1 PucR family transcriptional regulator [Leucobacter sp. OLAS13]PII96489.1 PucR family transcriptional regulator [Leucobacter sp. OLTLW20]PII96719.1 PucR family transcriptional regulator [Leucobacter sp. OLDS2]PII98171.1 PucR family transcriptional regulator [Leucobacter sp. OLCS4]
MDAGISPTVPIVEPHIAVTLGGLLAQLGPQSAELLGPADTDREVLGTEFYDALDELPDEPGAILLVPSGSALATTDLSALATAAAAARYAALALKCRDGEVATLTAVAETSGIPVLRVHERVGWRLFEALISQQLGEHRHTEDAHLDRGAEPLFALANELAEFFGGSVAIEDLGRRIIAYSSVPGQAIDPFRTQGILARHVPDSPFNDDQYRTAVRSDLPLKYPQMGEELPRVVAAIRAGALPLGTVWAIDPTGDGPITEEQIRRVRGAAAVAAAHMLNDLRVRDAGRIPRENRLRTLITGSGVVGSEFAELGIPEERGAALLGFEPGGRGDAAGRAAALDHPTRLAQLRTTVQRHLAVHRPEVVTVAHGGRVYALFACDRLDSAIRLAEPLLPILDRLLDTGTAIAAPGIVHRAVEVAPHRAVADRLFDTAAHWSVTDRVLTPTRLRPLLVFERSAELFAAEPELRFPQIRALVDADRPVAETLLAWCQRFGNVARTAADLGVHENTVRARLRRAERTHGIPLEDPDTLLTIWLQLRSEGVAE